MLPFRKPNCSRDEKNITENDQKVDFGIRSITENNNTNSTNSQHKDKTDLPDNLKRNITTKEMIIKKRRSESANISNDLESKSQEQTSEMSLAVGNSLPNRRETKEQDKHCCVNTNIENLQHFSPNQSYSKDDKAVTYGQSLISVDFIKMTNLSDSESEVDIIEVTPPESPMYSQKDNQPSSIMLFNNMESVEAVTEKPSTLSKNINEITETVSLDSSTSTVSDTLTDDDDSCIIIEDSFVTNQSDQINIERHSQTLNENQDIIEIIDDDISHENRPVNIQEHDKSINTMKNIGLDNNDAKCEDSNYSISTTKTEVSANTTFRASKCPICLESYADKRAACTECGHLFCLECIEASLTRFGKKCPKCRKNLLGKGYIEVYL